MTTKTYTPVFEEWRWYENNASEPSTALALQNTAPTLSDESIIRLRFSVDETAGGDPSSGPLFRIQVEDTTDDSGVWNTLGSGEAFNWANGLATEGNTLTGLLLASGPSQLGAYQESDGYSQTRHGKNDNMEFDASIVPVNGNYTAGNTYTFRLQIDATGGGYVTVPFGAGPDTWPSLVAPTISGDETVPVNMIGAEGSIFAPSVSGDANTAQNLIVGEASIFPVDVSVSTDVTVPVEMIGAEGSIFTPTISGDALVALETLLGRGLVEVTTEEGDALVSLSVVPGRVTPQASTAVGGSGETYFDIDTGGLGDYASLNAFQSGEADDISSIGDYIAECRASGGASDTASVSLASWTTGSNSLTVRQADSDRHSGIYSTSIYRLIPSGQNGIAVATSSTGTFNFDGLQISIVSASVDYCRGILVESTTSTDQYVIENCIILGTLSGTTNSCHGIASNWQTAGTYTRNVVIRNNLVYGFENTTTYTANGGIFVRQGWNADIHNNTVYDCYNGINADWDGNNDRYAFNNLIRNCSNNCYEGTSYDSTSDYNSADDSTATGINSTQTSGSPWDSSGDADSDYFADASSDDFRPGAGDLQINEGYDLSGTFDYDAVGNTRDGSTGDPFDLGFVEYVSSGDVTVPVSLIGAEGSLFAGSVTGTASVPVNLISGRATLYDVTVSLATNVSVPLNLIQAEGSLFTPVVTYGTSVSCNVIGVQGTPFAVTVTGTALADLNLIGVQATPYPVSVSVAGSINVPLNLLYGRGQVQETTVSYGSTVSLERVQAQGSIFTPTVSYGSNVEVNLVPGRATTFQVTVQVGGSISIPVNLIYGRGTPFDATVSGDASLSVNQVLGRAFVNDVSVGGGVGVDLSLLSAEGSMSASDVTGTAVVTTSLLSVQGTAFPVTVIVAGGISVPVNLIRGSASIFDGSISAGTEFAVSLLQATAQGQTVTVAGGATVLLEVLSGIASVFTPELSYDYEVTVNRVDGRAGTYAVTIVASGEGVSFRDVTVELMRNFKH